MNDNPIMVSVIITTRNEEINIKNCLESIKSQSYPADKIEIIVVDNNSIDKTKEIAKEYTQKVYDCGPERSAQRNCGVNQASGKYILYLDSDMILSENVISECVKMCESTNKIALYIPERMIGSGYWVRVRDFERSFYNATCVDCVRFVRRDKFLEIGGFDEELTGPEDWDFNRRIREFQGLGIIKNPIYHNERKFTISKFLQKKSYYSRTFSIYIRKWGKDDLIIKKQFGFIYRYFGVFIEDGKWKKIIRHPFLTAGMYFLRIALGFSYLKIILKLSSLPDARRR
jgi:glycosyltransferase involved in cell wall biosynthesis